MSISAITAGQSAYTAQAAKVQKQEEDTNWFSDWLN